VFVIHRLFSTLAEIVDYVLLIYMWIIIVRALLTWVNPDPYNPIVRFIHRVTEPVLRPIRYRLPTHQIGLDLSPMVAVLVIHFVGRVFLVPLLFDIAGRMT
jgi:YggT family protein